MELTYAYGRLYGLYGMKFVDKKDLCTILLIHIVNIHRPDKLFRYIAIYFIPITTPDKIYVRSTIYK